MPGITSAVAAPAAAGIPVTHRGVSAAVTVVTGHRPARGANDGDVDWRALAGVGGTIVVLMGVAQRGPIAAELIAGGLDPVDPGRRRHARPPPPTRSPPAVASTSWPTTPVESPAVLVIGAVAALDVRQGHDFHKQNRADLHDFAPLNQR